MTLFARSPDELIAVIPHLLGFKPEESLVLLPMSSELPTARVDLPTTRHDREVIWSSIRDAYSRHAQPGSSLAIVCVTGDRETATDVGHEFAARFNSIGIDTRVMLWADETRWADLDTGDMGLQTQAARERIAAATVLAGRAQPADTRDSLAESLVGDREPVARLLREARSAARANTGKLETRWAASRMQRFHSDGVRLSDADAARLLVAVESVPIRDQLWLDMNRSNAGSHVALWSDMTSGHPTRSAPPRPRCSPSSAGSAATEPWRGARSIRSPRTRPTRSRTLSPPPSRAACTHANGRQPTVRPREGWTTPPTSWHVGLLRKPNQVDPRQSSEEAPMETN